jgi:hypothetical protein
MERITMHQCGALNEALQIGAVDERTPDGANHVYTIELIGQLKAGGSPNTILERLHIYFQQGPLKEAGLNGISIEALLAVVIHHAQGFQGGPYKCRENACAITHLEEALMWLQKRTRERMTRGVEGTHTV